MTKKIITITMLIVLVILFTYTGISKLLYFTVFKEQIATSPILAPVSSIVAKALPLIEFITSLMLIVPKWRARGFFISMTLLLIFTIYIIAIMTLSKDQPCSCGGILEQISWQSHIVLNILLSTLSFICYKIEANKKSIANHELQITS